MTEQPTISNQLLQQLIMGDAQAFRHIYDTYQKQVFAFTFYLTKSKDTAEEAVQEVFIKLWEKRETLNQEMDLLSYIKRMAQNQVLNVYRKANRDKALQQKIYTSMAALHQLPADTLLEKQLTKLHAEAVEKLPPQKRIIYTLSRDHELTYEQIAEKLGLSKNTVRNHMTEAIQSVRGYVNNHTDLACLIIAIMLWESNNHN